MPTELTRRRFVISVTISSAYYPISLITSLINKFLHRIYKIDASEATRDANPTIKWHMCDACYKTVCQVYTARYYTDASANTDTQQSHQEDYVITMPALRDRHSFNYFEEMQIEV